MRKFRLALCGGMNSCSVGGLALALLASGVAQAQVNSGAVGTQTLIDQCGDLARADASKLSNTDLSKVDLSKCNQNYLLQQGNNIHALHQLYAGEKVNVLQGQINDPGTDKQTVFDNAVRDGVCLRSEQGQGAPAIDALNHCLDRAKRMAVDADLQARRSILKNNDGRRQLEDGKAQSLNGGLGAVGTSGASGGSGQNPDTIVKDFSQSVKQQQPNSPLQLLAAPQSVDFTGVQIGSGINGGGLDKVGTVDVKTETPQAADGQKDDTRKFQAADATNGTDDTAVSKALQDKQKQLSRELTDDATAISRQQPQPAAGASGRSLSTSISAQAFKGAIDRIRNGEIDKAQKSGLRGADAEAAADRALAQDNIEGENSIMAPATPPRLPPGASAAPPVHSIDGDLSNDLNNAQ